MLRPLPSTGTAPVACHVHLFHRQSLPSSLTLGATPSLSSLRLRPSPRLDLAIRCSAEGLDGPNAVAEAQSESFTVSIGSPPAVSLRGFKMGAADNGAYLLSFAACTTTIAFTSLVIAAVPTLFAMRRTAISLSKLADTAREELPSTMAAIRLSGMELSDLTLELNDLSQEIAEGVSKSAQAVQAAEAGIRQIGTLARNQTISMIEERANLPDISLRPVVLGAVKKTSRVVGQAGKNLLNFISGPESTTENDNPL